MQRRSWLLLVMAAFLIACGSSGDDASGDPCASGRGYAISVPGSKCSVYLSCGNQNQWRLDCSSGTGQCSCTKNDVEEKQVAYQDTFCPPDFNSKDMSSYYTAAGQACGWP